MKRQEALTTIGRELLVACLLRTKWETCQPSVAGIMSDNVCGCQYMELALEAAKKFKELGFDWEEYC